MVTSCSSLRRESLDLIHLFGRTLVSVKSPLDKYFLCFSQLPDINLLLHSLLKMPQRLKVSLVLKKTPKHTICPPNFWVQLRQTLPRDIPTVSQFAQWPSSHWNQFHFLISVLDDLDRFHLPTTISKHRNDIWSISHIQLRSLGSSLTVPASMLDCSSFLVHKSIHKALTCHVWGHISQGVDPTQSGLETHDYTDNRTEGKLASQEAQDIMERPGIGKQGESQSCWTEKRQLRPCWVKIYLLRTLRKLWQLHLMCTNCLIKPFVS